MDNSNVLNSQSSEIFKLLNPKENCALSKLKGLDLEEILLELDKYYLDYREDLGIPQEETFGLELEFENAKKENIKTELEEQKLDKSWRLKRDTSLEQGAEINSPILVDCKDSWQNLLDVCKILNKNSVIGEKAGGHIHVGTQTIGRNKDYWLNFIKLWSTYENIIFRFSYGEYLSYRPTLDEYAKTVSKRFLKVYKKLVGNEKIDAYDIVKKLSINRYQAVNFENVMNLDEKIEGNTIEFRCPNATLNPVIWQNNVNFFIKFLDYSKNKEFNNDIVEKRIRNKDNSYYDIALYDEIYLDQALELADILFDNNLDKVYFLRQYLKSFEIGNNTLEKAKQFTKVAN